MNSNSEFSIFQGASSIHLDSNKLRAEEEETKLDEIRRNAEVKFRSSLEDYRISLTKQYF
jgi:hypothetical protein